MGRELDQQRAAREREHINTFKGGSICRIGTEYGEKNPLRLKFISHEGPRSVCFTGKVIVGNDLYKVGDVKDTWVYFAFKVVEDE